MQKERNKMGTHTAFAQYRPKGQNSKKNIFLGLDHFMIYEPRQDFICDRSPSWSQFWGFVEKNVFSANKIKLSLPHLYI